MANAMPQRPDEHADRGGVVVRMEHHQVHEIARAAHTDLHPISNASVRGNRSDGSECVLCYRLIEPTVESSETETLRLQFDRGTKELET